MIKKSKLKIKNSFLVGLSPMDGVTDAAYRQTQVHIAKPDILFTEFVSAEGISRGGVRLYDQLLYSENERPIIGQIFGKDPDSFYKAAIILCHLGFDGIDINMGCPAKTVTQHGSGAALIAQPQLASNLILSVRKGIDDYCSGKVTINDIGLKKPSLEIIKRNRKYTGFSNHCSLITNYYPTLSVKTRLGISESVIDSWIPHLLSHHLDFLTLHGRTLKQGYSGLADWEAIQKATALCRQANTPIFGNGDITSLRQAREYGQKYGVDGILIGRASMGNPWVFADHTPSWAEKFATLVYHTHQFLEIFPHRKLDSMRKHFILYSSGHPHAKQLRTEVVKVNTLADLYSLEPLFLNC